MSKDDNNPSGGGLLSKMVKFVRNPTVNWNELDSIEDSRESQYSKQMLKEMIERKRRNDFVRRREFDQLRKLRQREALQGQRTEDPTARPSFFQSSMASPDERAVTLKKIDEIEAQMSQQWWKSKSAADAPTQPAHLASSEESHARAFAPTAPLSLPSPLPPGQTIEPLFDHDSMAVSRFGTVSAPGVGRHMPDAPPPPPRAVVPEPVAFVHEPDLEEASILFANGDTDGAEANLLDVLAQHEGDPPAQQIEIWMTLFDLYRAIDEHERFDALSINFAGRFEQSAPLWFSMPELAGLAAESAKAGLLPQREFQWSAPPTLTAQTLAALTASLSRAAPPWTLTWSRTTAIEDNAVAPLADLFSQWAEEKLQLSFFGVEALNAVLEAHTQSGDREARPEWWRLRMAMLRLMNRSEEFELVALDYCVTYEVSPPQWAPPLCSYTGDNGTSADATAPDAGLASTLYDSEPPLLGGDDAQPTASLAGHIEGDASALLEPFGELLPPGVPLVISCERLIRIDFAAAGSVLNWTAAQQAQGRVVHFAQLQRLVAVFFNVIGINEHAWVIPRKN